MEKLWFEMKDLIRKEYSKSVWIPIYACQELRKEGRISYDGYVEEFIGSTAVLFPLNDKDQALKLKYNDISMSHDSRPYADENGYRKAGSYEHYGDELKGEHLVLRQYFDYSDDKAELHVDQDLILGLQLLRKRDVWILHKENNVEVIKLIRDGEGKPVRVDIKAEYLKDYLAARNSGVLLGQFYLRRVVVSDPSKIGFPDDFDESLEEENYRWSGRCYAIHEGNGSPYGSEMAVFHVGRTDVDENEDIPEFQFPMDENVKSEQKVVKMKGEKVYMADGSLWKTEWVDPAPNSPRVRGDKSKSNIGFIVDNSGKKLNDEDLERSSGYLWFKPNLAKAILNDFNGTLGWFTGDTGSLGLPKRSVHFGVNSIGLINVFAKDVALLPEFDQKIWVSHNISPEGGVSSELLEVQQRAVPARTSASEVNLIRAIQYCQEMFMKTYGSPFLKESLSLQEIQNKIHRFQSTDNDGLLLLSKEIVRLIIENIDIDLLKQSDPQAEQDLGSIKRIERILNNMGFKGRKITTPLVCAYDLRLKDAHLSSEDDISQILDLIDISSDENIVQKGLKLIDSVGFSFYCIAKAHNLQ